MNPVRKRSWAVSGYILTASVCVVLLLFGFGGWAAFAQLDSAVVVRGTLDPGTATVPVRHLGGGLVRALHIREGDLVDAGEALLEMDGARTRR